MPGRRQQVQVLYEQARRGQRLLESETAALMAELNELYVVRQALEQPKAQAVAPTAGLLSNAARHGELVETRRAAVMAEIVEAEARLAAQQMRLRQARQAVAGWELLAGRVEAQARPVSSVIGSASMSARTAMVRPGRTPSMTPTKPVGVGLV